MEKTKEEKKKEEWGIKEIDIDQFLNKMTDNFKLSADIQEMYDTCRRNICDALNISIIYFAGFENINTSGILSASVDPTTVDWVRKISRSQSGMRIAGFISANICSSLEAFIAYIGDIKIDVDEAFIAYIGDIKIDVDNVDAKNNLLRMIKPSVKADGLKWISSLEDVFSVKIPSVIKDSIISMIQFRNVYTHDMNKAQENFICGEQLKCWSGAGLLLSNILVSTVNIKNNEEINHLE